MSYMVKNTLCFTALLACALTQPASYAQQSGWGKTDPANKFDLTITQGHTGAASDEAVTLHSDTAPPDVFAAAGHATPTTRWQGKVVCLRATLTTDNAATGATIWMAAYAGTKQVAFSNTHSDPLPADSQNSVRTTLVLIPRDATRSVFGVLLKGKGKVTATAISLSALDDEKLADGTLLPEAVMREALSDIQENALNAARIDWKTETPRLLAFSHTALLADVYAELKSLIKNLDDHHSLIVPPWKRAAFTHMWHTLPQTKALSPDIHESVLTGFTSRDPKEADAYRNALLSAIRASNSVKGWVLDLRNNQGGNMWPMLAGLKPFLGNAPLGYFLNRSEEKSAPWSDNLSKGQRDTTVPDLSTIPMAVLIGPHTASSGEAVAIAFKGRPNTRFFGTPTAGQTSGNQTFTLPDGGLMPLATSFETDRTGVVYKHGVDPDERTDDDAATLQAATAWLHNRTSL